MENNLPKGWVECFIGEILVSRKGKKPDSTISEARTGYFPYILIDELEGKPIRSYTKDGTVPKVSKSDVLLVWDGSIGKCGSGLEGAIGSTLVALTPLGGIPTKFLEYTIKYANSYIKETSTGTGLQHINKDFLKTYSVPLPPLAEQQRIVAKLDELMEKIDRSRARLERIPKILKRFRQSILSAAVSGKLTEEWRGKNSKIESGEDLILRIKELRSKRYDDACKKALKEGKRKPSNFDNYNVNLRSDFDLFEIPDNWRWVDFRFVMSEEEAFCYGVVQPGDEANDGNFLIRAGDLKNNTVDTTSLRTISKIVDAEYSRSKVSGGELLITVVGAGIGECGIVPKSCKGYNIARAVAKIPIKDFNSKYILLWLNSSAANKWMKAEAREVARPTLNLEQLRTIPLPLPSSEEQNEIVRRVEQLFALADKIEGRYTKAKAQVDKLPQSLLAKAFRGELVAQDVNDEPASVLLERIRNAGTHLAKKSRKHDFALSK